MSGGMLDRLASRHGVTPSHRNMDGSRTAVPDATKRAVLAALGVDAGSTDAVRQALKDAGRVRPPALRKVEGARCFLPSWLENERAWGVSLQLYELRSRRNWGIGDFADLADFCGTAGAAGADFIGLNPLHALFLAGPERCSPFSPSNRLFLNPLYIAPDRLPSFTFDRHEQDRAAKLREPGFVDYPAVRDLKLPALRRTFRAWQKGLGPDAPFDRAGFEKFRAEGGGPLFRHGLFEALSDHMVKASHGAGWQDWPINFRRADDPSVAAFAAAHADDVLFHVWLQWIAKLQLDQAAEAARAAGMRIGLYLDLAVGEAPDGSATWSEPDLFAPRMSVGAPPDMFTAGGQDWGLAPLSPPALARTGFARHGALLNAVMAAGGALRIDHAMALWQLFFVPEGASPAEGAYVRYPLDRLLGLLAERSRTHGAIVVGEDLGNVPRGFRPVMQAANVLSYRILPFEQRNGRFIPAASYPKLALACLATHDLPTWKGFWRGDDVGLRSERGLIDAAAAQRQHRERSAQREGLIQAFMASGALAKPDLAGAGTALNDPSVEPPPSLAIAAHRFIAKTPSLLVGVRLADLVGESRSTNLPGTADSYPNWRLKLPVLIEEAASLESFRAIAGAVAAERPRRA